MDTVVDDGGRVRILAVKGLDETLANKAAVLVIGLRQHDDKLRSAAAADDIALTQAGNKQFLQVFHGNIKTAASQRLFVLTVQ